MWTRFQPWSYAMRAGVTRVSLRHQYSPLSNAASSPSLVLAHARARPLTPSTPSPSCHTLQRFISTSPVEQAKLAPTTTSHQRKALFKERNSKYGLLSYPHFERLDESVSIVEFCNRYAGLKSGIHVEDERVQLVGRVVSRRDSSKKLVFCHFESGGTRLQMVASKKRFDSDDAFDSQMDLLRRGDIIEVIGHAGTTNRGELSIFAHQIKVLSPCLHDIPTGLKDVETLSRLRHLKMLVDPDFVRALTLKSKMIQVMREFFTKRGFVEVETPILWSGVGGATAKPFFTRSHALDRDLALRIATELFLKTLVVGGIERVFEIGKQFRNEGIDSTHNPEFTTCEAYMAYADFEDLTTMTEDLVRDVLVTTTGTSIMSIPTDTACPLVIDLAEPFKRIDVVPTLETLLEEKLPDFDEADSAQHLLRICASQSLSLLEPHTVPVLMDRLIGALLEPLCVQPTFLINHPLAMSPLAKEHPTRKGLASRFELFVNGTELCNAYQELNDPDEQRERFQQQLAQKDLGDDEVPLPDEVYCQALEYGLPPTVGLGIGIDRLAMLAVGATHIRDVLTFPMLRHEVPSPGTDNVGPTPSPAPINSVTN
eukprot:m.148732 g.148732  ORF g.148732 m.148732 type:complete len:597 (+) comp30616_c0_seq2:268-2058(+)